MLTIATMLWEANEHSRCFSLEYDESWVEKLYRGFARNLTRPFEFVCFVDRLRKFSEPIAQQTFRDGRTPDYGSCIEPFILNEPSIIVGLDTIITGNIDHLADWCMTAVNIALPNPYGKLPCNGVVLCPAGKRAIFDAWGGENDMEWLRLQPHETIDAMWPGDVVSYKAHVRGKGLGKARIVYFHGVPKATAVKEPWVQEHWV
ncbi:hypothetical protein [Mesorhizobium sp.]|uniref:hypothetical protein n=1 Tax=Mesorhizobium sp. TaxID=1871066 RepID=UPI000FEAA20C|nr:hypothetical protein [Mesorhizobium sp.]RWN33442.1 MAG: hypothetical protein EOR95_15965 [Mesorhizobium sp.]